MLIPLSLRRMVATPRAKLEVMQLFSAAFTWIPRSMPLIRFNGTAFFLFGYLNIPFLPWPSLFHSSGSCLSSFSLTHMPDMK